ncbi:MAG: hypothetical protein ACJ8ER_17640 [Allosphingosinicella sp.]
MSAVKPDTPRRETSRDRPTSSASRSKRLIELEAAVRSLPIATAERDSDAGPQGM